MPGEMAQQLILMLNKLMMKFVIIVLSISITTGCYTSIISFGDSIADTGNLLHVSNPDHLPHFAFPPYGDSYFHTPTGRCSDGRLIIDFIAEYLGLPLVPPYFGSKVDDLKWGVNFAVGGATALDNSFFEDKGIHNSSTNISLQVQLALFKQLLPRLFSTTPSCHEFLGNSLVLMGEIGGNDYNHAFLQGFSPDEIREFVPLVVRTIGSVIKEMIELGAKTILVPGNFPIGCSPAYLTYFNRSEKEDFDPSTGCINWLNDFSLYHNELLQIQLRHIQELHPNVTIIYADYYNAAMQLYRSPREFGFVGEDTLKSCCGIGGTNNYDRSPSAWCGYPLATSCDDPSSYISWDGIHYTEAMYRLTTTAILQGPFSIPPFKTSTCGDATYIKTQ